VLIHCGLPLRYTHDLDELLSSAEDAGIAVPEPVREAAVLTSYAWEMRYPSLGEPVQEDECREAVAQAEAVVIWAKETIGL